MNYSIMSYNISYKQGYQKKNEKTLKIISNSGFISMG